MDGKPGGRAGGELTLKREFTLLSAAGFAFAFISPIVALYAIFGLSITAGGPAAWWGFWFVLAGQLLVAACFAQLASKWPLEGSIYQWSRRLLGESYGWFAGWAYIWTLTIAAGTVCFIAAGFVPVVLDIEPFSSGEQLLVALGLLAFVTLINLWGRTAMKVMILIVVAAEVIGTLGVGTVLLFFHNEQSPSVLFEGMGAAYGSGPYLWSGMLAAMAFIGWSFVGFESAGAISEEVHEPRRDVPKAILGSIAIVGAVVIYGALGLILAIPDYGAVLSGEVADPVAGTLALQLGSGVTRPLFVAFIAAFLASALALQASASRVLWAYAREGTLPASRFLRVLSARDRIPLRTISLAALMSVLVLFSTQSEDIYLTLVSFTTGGFYIAFAFPVVALLIRKLSGRFDAPWSFGRWSLPISAVAAAWCVFELINIAWPRAEGVPWYEEYGVIVMVAIVAAVGALVYATHREQIRSADLGLRGEEEEPERAPAPGPTG